MLSGQRYESFTVMDAFQAFDDSVWLRVTVSALTLMALTCSVMIVVDVYMLYQASAGLKAKRFAWR